LVDNEQKRDHLSELTEYIGPPYGKVTLSSPCPPHPAPLVVCDAGDKHVDHGVGEACSIVRVDDGGTSLLLAHLSLHLEEPLVARQDREGDVLGQPLVHRAHLQAHIGHTALILHNVTLKSEAKNLVLIILVFCCHLASKIILNQSDIFACKILVTLQTAKQAYCEDDGEVSRILGVPTLLMQVELAPALHLVEHVAVPGLTPRVPATIEAPDKRARWQRQR